MSSQKKIFAITAIALLGLFIVAAYLFKQDEFKNSEKLATENKSLLVRDYSPSKGSAMLRVTLVEFLDPECESCAYFHPIVKDILSRYEGQVRYVVRYAPFHPNSKFVIQLLEAARVQGKYWEALDLFFEKLPEWGSHQSPKPELLWTYLPQLGLDVDKIKIDMKDERILRMIEQETKDGNTFGVRRTPSFFINGQPLRNFGPDQLEEAISAALD